MDMANANLIIDERKESDWHSQSAASSGDEAEEKGRASRRSKADANQLPIKQDATSSFGTDFSLTDDEDKDKRPLSSGSDESEQQDYVFRPKKNPIEEHDVQHLYKKMLHQRRLVDQRKQRRQQYLVSVEKIKDLKRTLQTGPIQKQQKTQKVFGSVFAKGKKTSATQASEKAQIDGEESSDDIRCNEP